MVFQCPLFSGFSIGTTTQSLSSDCMFLDFSKWQSQPPLCRHSAKGCVSPLSHWAQPSFCLHCVVAGLVANNLIALQSKSAQPTQRSPLLFRKSSLLCVLITKSQGWLISFFSSPLDLSYYPCLRREVCAAFGASGFVGQGPVTPFLCQRWSYTQSTPLTLF